MLNKSDIRCVSLSDISSIEEKALNSDNGRYRICLHKSHNDKLQDMIIAMSDKSRIAPHRRLNSSRTYSIFSGEMVFVLFDDAGREINRYKLGADNRVLHISSEHYILPIPKTKMVVFHEVSEGPFENNDDYAPWFKEGLFNSYYR